MSRHLRGIAAEDAAAKAYEARGGKVLARRWRAAEGEIDLVIALGDELVFAEVKARRDHAGAALSVSPRQWTRIAAAAERFMAETGQTGRPCRFDLVTVDAAGVVALIENAASFDEW